MENERIPLEDLSQLSCRSISILVYDAKIKYLDELLEKTAVELKEVKGLGGKTLREIRQVLASYNFCLKGDFLADSENDKKLIQEIPILLDEMKDKLIELSKYLKFIEMRLDNISFNLQPLKNKDKK